MLLEDKFYSVREIVEKQSGNYNVTIFLNQEHPIFQAHFPGNPVTPGACMIQITKELVQQILGFKVFMQKTSNVKFTAIINPFVNSELQLNLEIDSTVDECIKVKNSVYFDDVMALKMVCLYTKIEG